MGAIIIGSKKMVRNTRMPRTGRSSSSANATPNSISRPTARNTKASVTNIDVQACGLVSASMKLSKPENLALLHGVPKDQSYKDRFSACAIG